MCLPSFIFSPYSKLRGLFIMSSYHQTDLLFENSPNIVLKSSCQAFIEYGPLLQKRCIRDCAFEHLIHALSVTVRWLVHDALMKYQRLCKEHLNVAYFNTIYLLMMSYKSYKFWARPLSLVMFREMVIKSGLKWNATVLGHKPLIAFIANIIYITELCQ